LLAVPASLLTLKTMNTPKSKTSSRLVTRILDRTTSPVYVVDADQLIAYANGACADWVGVELEQLIGAKCVFSSQSQAPSQNESFDDRVQGLCPPPQLFESDSVNSKHEFAVSVVDQNRNVSWRSAAMSRLRGNHGEPGSDYGILVVCGDVCEPPEFDAISCMANPSHLHAALMRIRTRTDRLYNFESLVGISPHANRVRRQTKTAISSDVDLLIHGPRGTGKEHLACTIHSARQDSGDSSDSELLPVHCSIADQHLLQQNIQDLIGNQVSSRKANDPADNTTNSQDWLLLLDVDQLGEAAQIELMEFIKLPEFPLRTIATASQSLIELAEQGRYLQELAFHLSTMSIQLAPLRDRLADVPLLSQALLERDNFRRERQLSGFSKNAIELLCEFNWPENIDQLNRTIQSAASRASTSQIDVADLPDQFTGALSAMRIGTAVETSIQLDSYLAEIEKQLVDRALKHAKGNKTKAAKLLGISRPKLLSQKLLKPLATQILLTLRSLRHEFKLEIKSKAKPHRSGPFKNLGFVGSSNI